MKSIVCLVDSARGSYVPQAFIELYDKAAWHVSSADAEILRAGPDHPDYWDTWDNVLNCAHYVAHDGRTFTLYQDGDLFAVAIDAMTDAEYLEFFGEDR